MKSSELIAAIEDGKMLIWNDKGHENMEYDMRIEFYSSNGNLGYFAYGCGSAHVRDVGNILKLIMEVPDKFRIAN